MERKKPSVGSEGFTIVELMVTLLILGILAGIVVATMSASRSKTQEAACKSNLRNISSAICEYQAAHNGDYPPNLDVLTTEGYIKSSFKWTCPSGPLDGQSTDYRDNYDPAKGETSCPRASHNP
ncbi:MAG: prepilin-type N-terminal cleavage/methylation domain-containing protein [Actinomycetota bacterium]|nr:prepilin-type N-terminal cleavage/methylation domain-containing protein [Actinomycetota bacterium]